MMASNNCDMEKVENIFNYKADPFIQDKNGLEYFTYNPMQII